MTCGETNPVQKTCYHDAKQATYSKQISWNAMLFFYLRP